MSSVECLRELISERLTAAAEEIFTVVKKITVEREEEIDRQRRLLDSILNPVVKLHTTGLYNLSMTYNTIISITHHRSTVGKIYWSRLLLSS